MEVCRELAEITTSGLRLAIGSHPRRLGKSTEEQEEGVLSAQRAARNLCTTPSHHAPLLGALEDAAGIPGEAGAGVREGIAKVCVAQLRRAPVAVLPPPTVCQEGARPHQGRAARHRCCHERCALAVRGLEGTSEAT